MAPVVNLQVSTASGVISRSKIERSCRGNTPQSLLYGNESIVHGHKVEIQHADEENQGKLESDYIIKDEKCSII